MAPDLRASFVMTTGEPFARIVRGGSHAPRGMPMYAAITGQELAALQHLIRQRAAVALTQKP